MRTFYAVYHLVQRLNRLAVGLASLLIVLIIVFTDWEAFTRYFLRSPAMWTYPVSSYLLLYSIYLAMAYTLQKGGHVGVEFVVEALPRGARRWLERLGHALGLAFTLIFLHQSYRLFLRQSTEGQRDISNLSTPLGLVSFALPLGLSLMAVTYVLVLVDSFLRPPGQTTLQEQERAGAGVELQFE
ncbi:MAG: TRAP transporter small permease [Chloroflexi bacterium]|nr:TRAP transporter small permease [Chloroflexota bacterium]